MTAFTDDLDNDLEVLAEHHDVTPVQVAKAALALVPDYIRHALIGSMWAALPQPVSEDPHPAEAVEPVSETGLPQKLRGSIHELTRHYPANLVVDAAMLEMPEERRVEVAKTFLPKKPLRDKLDEIRAQKEAAKAEMFAVIDVASNEELGLIAQPYGAIRVLDGKTGQPISYKHVRTEYEYDFREDEAIQPRKLALYSKVTAG
jgi:hypothetical protein